MAETKYKQTEIGPIPEDWEVVKIGEISSSRMYGVGASAIGYDGRTKYIRITDIDDNYGRFVPNPLTSPQYSLDRHIVREDDLLVARTGASVGKTYLYDKADGRLVFAGFLMKVHIDRGSSKYIFYQTKTNFYKLWVESESARTGQPGINIKQFENFSVPLPSLPEQHAIASALTSVDNLIASLDKLIAKTQSVKQGAMQQLLTRLNSEMVEYKKLGDICQSLPKETLKTTQLKDSGYPVVNSGKEYYGYYSSYNNEGNAITIASRGDAGYVKYIGQKFWAGGLCYPYRSINEKLYATNYLYFYLKGKEKAIMDDLVERTSIPALNKADVELIEIPIPSIETQQRIASTLTAIDDQVSALEAKRKKYEMVKVGMLQQLLTGKIRLK